MITKILYSAYRKSCDSWIMDALLIAAGSCLIALSAPLSMRLPFTPVAITFKHCVCLSLGVLLGSRRGSLAVLAYLVQGAMGLPVFAVGAAGWMYLLGPTGGYYVGWLVGTYVTGYIAEQIGVKTSFKYFVALLAGSVVIYLFALPHLAFFVGWKAAISLGLAPFFLIDLIRWMLLAPLLKRYAR